MDAFDNKSDFLKSAKAARESRQKDKQLQISATKIQVQTWKYLNI